MDKFNFHLHKMFQELINIVFLHVLFQGLNEFFHTIQVFNQDRRTK